MAEKSVYYIGPSSAGVDVPMPDGLLRHVERGAALETTAEHAASLLKQQDNWSATPPGKAKPGKEG